MIAGAAALDLAENGARSPASSPVPDRLERRLITESADHQGLPDSAIHERLQSYVDGAFGGTRWLRS
jgi:hypothetical protein